jgi:hypothetical protein
LIASSNPIQRHRRTVSPRCNQDFKVRSQAQAPRSRRGGDCIGWARRPETVAPSSNPHWYSRTARLGAQRRHVMIGERSEMEPVPGVLEQAALLEVPFGPGATELHLNSLNAFIPSSMRGSAIASMPRTWSKKLPNSPPPRLAPREHGIRGTPPPAEARKGRIEARAQSPPERIPVHSSRTAAPQ